MADIMTEPRSSRYAPVTGAGWSAPVRSPSVEVVTTLDDEKSALLSRAIDLAGSRTGSGGPPAEVVEPLLTAYYNHVAPEDVCSRSDIDLYGAVASHYRLAEQRPHGTSSLRVFTPGLVDDGWSAAGHSVVEVVTD